MKTPTAFILAFFALIGSSFGQRASSIIAMSNPATPINEGGAVTYSCKSFGTDYILGDTTSTTICTPTMITSHSLFGLVKGNNLITVFGSCEGLYSSLINSRLDLAAHGLCYQIKTITTQGMSSSYAYNIKNAV